MVSDEFIRNLIEERNPLASQAWIVGFEAAFRARPHMTETAARSFVEIFHAEADGFVRGADAMRAKAIDAMRELADAYETNRISAPIILEQIEEAFR